MFTITYYAYYYYQKCILVACLGKMTNLKYIKQLLQKKIVIKRAKNKKQRFGETCFFLYFCLFQ